jgi:hypothetical protein
MKGQTIAVIAGGILLLLLVSKRAGAVDLSSLNDQFDAGRVARLQGVANELSARGITGDTLKFLLAQILVETGLFTNVANMNAVDNLNNYAGISSNGQLRAYGTISDFVDDYLRVLNLPNNYPIQATDINDFNARLKANGYYEDSATTYGNNLVYYFNLLS